MIVLLLLLIIIIAIITNTIVSGKITHTGNSGIVAVGSGLKVSCCVGEFVGDSVAVGESVDVGSRFDKDVFAQVGNSICMLSMSKGAISG